MKIRTDRVRGTLLSPRKPSKKLTSISPLAELSDLKRSNNLVSGLLNTLNVVKGELHKSVRFSKQWVDKETEYKQKIATLEKDLAQVKQELLEKEGLQTEHRQLKKIMMQLQRETNHRDACIKSLELQKEINEQMITRMQLNVRDSHRKEQQMALELDSKAQELGKLTIVLKEHQSERLYREMSLLEKDKQIEALKKVIKESSDCQTKMQNKQRILNRQLKNLANREQEIMALTRDNNELKKALGNVKKELQESLSKLSFYDQHPIDQIKTNINQIKELQIVGKMKQRQSHLLKTAITQHAQAIAPLKKQLSSFYTCSSCKALFRNSSILFPCQHVFCSDCEMQYDPECTACKDLQEPIGIINLRGMEQLSHLFDLQEKLAQHAI